MTTHPLLKIPEAAKALNVSIRTIAMLIARGDLPSVKLGRCTRIRGSALDSLIDAREARRNPRTAIRRIMSATANNSTP